MKALSNLISVFVLFCCMEERKVNCDEVLRSVSELLPSFAEPIPNITVPVGRDVRIPCVVENIGFNRAAWIKVESKAILSIHDHVITRNYRISLSHVDNRNFVLQIKDVKDSDRGGYMCQVNTAPMMSQVGYLDVVFPPEIQRENTSSDMITKEGSNVTLACVAKGYPTPNITWRREDSQPIVPLNIERQLGGAPNQVSEKLSLIRVSRSQIGAYLCIAMNGVPPSVSQRMLLQIYFQPEVKIKNSKIGAHLGATALLSCHIEALPFPEIVWDKNVDTKITSGLKHEIDVAIKKYQIQSVLRVRNLQPFDFGMYKCIAINSLGRTEGEIQLYEIPWPTLTPTTMVLSMSSTSQGTSSWNGMPNLSELVGDHTHSPKELPQAAKEGSSLYDETSNARGSKSVELNEPRQPSVSGHKGNSQSVTSSVSVFGFCVLPFIVLEVIT